MKLKFCLTFLIIWVVSTGLGQKAHSFQIKNGNFQLDNKPIMIYSGEMHFSRVPRAYWRQRLEMIKAMGMNTVATYVFWNYHEKAPGVWDFKTGNHDMADFIKTAQQVGLFVILRPGPYACAEWDFGGFPWWLSKNKNLQLRTDNPAFLDSAKVYIDHLASQVRDLQITHGGPVIMVQVENEYGSYVIQQHIPKEVAHAYTDSIKHFLREAGINVPMYTADGTWAFKGGAVEGVLPAANGEDNLNKLRDSVNAYHHNQGPYFVSEFYPGWLDHWAEPFQRVPARDVAKQLDQYLKNGVSFNFYMAEGGTNFGFASGANYDSKHPIQPDITSYDYDAPITEAGWPTPKFYSIRNEMAKYSSRPLTPVPKNYPVISIPPIKLNQSVDLFEIAKTIKPIVSDAPICFEDLNQGSGYVLYRRKFKVPLKGILAVFGLRDYGQVYINGKFVSILNRMDSIFTCPVNIPANGVLDILVENLGRINYGAEIIHNFKGIISPVLINQNAISGHWEMFKFPFSSPTDLGQFPVQNNTDHPTLYSGSFVLGKTGDTFLDMKGWGKGIVFVNGHNLGRYWHLGPQQTLYLPGSWLRKGLNRVMIFEELNFKKHVELSTTLLPVLNDLLVPKKD